MGEQTQNLPADTGHSASDPEKTLVAPRFDAREVVTAQPVVPLADPSPARRASRPQRQGTLPLVLILVSALVGGLVSVFAYRLYQQRAEQSSAREQQQPANVEAPPVTPDISAAATETPAATTEVVEEPTPETEVAEVREETVAPEETLAPEEADEREEAREDRAGRDLEPVRASATREERPAATTMRRPTARRVEEIKTPTEDLRVRRGRGDGREASDYEVPARPRAERRAARRAERRAARREDRERNIDRVRAIFEGRPPGL